jgi:hypothetical protein
MLAEWAFTADKLMNNKGNKAFIFLSLTLRVNE